MPSHNGGQNHPKTTAEPKLEKRTHGPRIPNLKSLLNILYQLNDNNNNNYQSILLTKLN